MNRFSIQYKLALNTYWTQGTYLDEPGNDVHISKLNFFFLPTLELLWWFKIYAYSTGDLDSVPESERPPGEGDG